MKINIINKNFLDINSNLIILPVFEDILYKELEQVDAKLNNRITELIKEKDFEAKLNQVYLIETLGKLNQKRILLVGLGKESELTLEKIRQAYGTSSKIIKSLKITNYSTLLINCKFKPGELAQVIVEGSILGAYKFDKFKSKVEKKIDYLDIITKETKEIESAIKKAQILADSVYLARDLVNNPSSIKTPVYIGEFAKKIAKESGLKCTVLQKKDIEKLKMGCLLGVSKGSAQPPVFVILEYYNNKKKSPVVLVGKGITFDSGGINLKPWDGMKDMKQDMSGAASVLGIMRTVALLKLNVNLVGLMPITENMPGGNSMKPGDILTSYSGKNIEMQHTDAEGRLILSDALSFAEKNFKPSKIIDLATLTGACVIALGTLTAGLFSDNNDLVREIIKASQESGERVWQLPFYEEFKRDIESVIADVKNLGNPKGSAGAITAAVFLREFVEKTPWAHLDIAGTAFSDENMHYLVQGGTGYGIRLLTQFLINESYK